MTRRGLLLVLGLAPFAARRASAQSFGAERPEDRYFSVDVTLRDGGSVAEGYVNNRYDQYTQRVGLALEPRDAAGRSLGIVRTVVRDVPARFHAYFRTRLPAPAASVRAWVEYFEWAPRGGGGM